MQETTHKTREWQSPTKQANDLTRHTLVFLPSSEKELNLIDKKDPRLWK